MAWRILLVLLLTLASWSTRPAAAADGDGPFTEARLRQLLARNPQTGQPVDSVSELVPLLPEELRQNFALVYDSRSPFKASITPERPRVILFTDDARLVLTFIGDEPAAQRRAWRPSAAEAKCERCHGADSRPIYDSYPLWPGYHGAVLDTFPKDRLRQRDRKNFAAFRAGAANTGAYKDLIYPEGSPVTPFLDPRLFNARFGTALNRQRIYRKLAAGPRFAADE